MYNLDMSSVPNEYGIDESLLPYKKNRKYGWGRKFNVFVTPGGNHYHRSRCSCLKGSSKKLMHVYKAMEKYTPCAHCHPQSFVDTWYNYFLKDNSVAVNPVQIEMEHIQPAATLNVIPHSAPPEHVNRKLKIAVIVLSVLVILLSAFAGICVERVLRFSSAADELEQKAQQLSVEVEKAKLGDWEAKARAMDQHIVFVSQGGNCYHRYKCYHLNGKYQIPCRVYSAIGKGYKACSDCKPPKSE